MIDSIGTTSHLYYKEEYNSAQGVYGTLNQENEQTEKENREIDPNLDSSINCPE